MLDTNLKRTAHTLPFFSEFRPDINLKKKKNKPFGSPTVLKINN